MGKTNIIELTPALMQGISRVLQAIASGNPLAHGAFTKAPLSVVARVNQAVRAAARSLGIEATKTGIVSHVRNEQDFDALLGRLLELKRKLLDGGAVKESDAPTPKIARRGGGFIQLTDSLFKKILLVRSVLEDGEAPAFGIFTRGVITIPVRASGLARFVGRQVGICPTPTGLLFVVTGPESCDAILAQLLEFKKHLMLTREELDKHFTEVAGTSGEATACP